MHDVPQEEKNNPSLRNTAAHLSGPGHPSTLGDTFSQFECTSSPSLTLPSAFVHAIWIVKGGTFSFCQHMHIRSLASYVNQHLFSWGCQLGVFL